MYELELYSLTALLLLMQLLQISGKIQDELYNPNLLFTFWKNLDSERTPSAIVMNGKVVSGLTIKEVK